MIPVDRRQNGLVDNDCRRPRQAGVDDGTDRKCSHRIVATKRPNNVSGHGRDVARVRPASRFRVQGALAGGGGADAVSEHTAAQRDREAGTVRDGQRVSVERNPVIAARTAEACLRQRSHSWGSWVGRYGRLKGSRTRAEPRNGQADGPGQDIPDVDPLEYQGNQGRQVFDAGASVAVAICAIRTDGIGPAGRIAEARISQVGTGKVIAGQVGCCEIRTRQVGAAQVDVGQVGVLKTCAGQVSSGEIDSSHTRVVERGLWADQ